VGMNGTSNVNERLKSAISTANMEALQINSARSAQVHFKTQVQEWKDVLLRGKDQAMYDKHYEGFGLDEAAGKNELPNLLGLLRTGGDDTTKVVALMADHAQLGARYREALQHFAGGNGVHVVDSLVRGMDRAPSAAFDSVVAEQLKDIDSSLSVESHDA